MKPTILGLLILTLAVSGWAADNLGGGSSTGGGNPLYTYCEKAGGKVVGWKETGGSEHAFCHLGNAYIEGWTLVSGILNQGRLQAKTAFFTHPTPQAASGNPANAYCSQVGAQAVSAVDENGDATGYCEFADGGRIEQWTLWRGPQDAANEALTRVLRDGLPPKVATEAESGQTFALSGGETLDIQLRANASSGYRWLVVQSGGPDLQLERQYSVDDPHPPGAVGYGSTDHFEFRCHRGKNIPVVLEYVGPTGHVARTFQLYITFDL